MTSFVREILSASGKLGENKEDLATKIAKAQKSVEERKAALRNAAEAKFLDYQDEENSVSALAALLESSVRDAEALEANLRLHLKSDLADASNDLQEVCFVVTTHPVSFHNGCF